MISLKKKQALLGLALLLAAGATGCVWTRRAPADNRGPYQLVRDRKVYPCWRVIDRSSYWFGQRKVTCLQSEGPGSPEGSRKDPPAIGGKYYPKGTPVHIRKIRYVGSEDIAIVAVGEGRERVLAYAAFPDVLRVLERPPGYKPRG